MTYHAALGTDPPNAYIPIVSAPVAVPHPYATMTVCDAQRHLISAGFPLVPDGAWGTKSKTAFSDWAKRRPLAEARTVMPTGYNALPTFGTREDYKLDNGRIRIPAIYAAALPAMARVACSGARVPSPSAPDALLSSDPTAPDGDVTYSPGTGESEGMGAWPWLLLAAAAAAGGGYYWWKKRKYPGT